MKRHIVPTKDAKKQAAEKLLQQGSITVGYEGHLTEHDVITLNGLIHYIDNVLVEPEVPDVPDNEKPTWICHNVGQCGTLTPYPQRDDCLAYLAVCDEDVNLEDCAQGAGLICIDINIRDLLF